MKVPAVVQYANKQAYMLGKIRKSGKKADIDLDKIEDKEKMRNTLYFL